jgi:hypothetical protein
MNGNTLADFSLVINSNRKNETKRIDFWINPWGNHVCKYGSHG